MKRVGQRQSDSNAAVLGSLRSLWRLNGPVWEVDSGPQLTGCLPAALWVSQPSGRSLLWYARTWLGALILPHLGWCPSCWMASLGFSVPCRACVQTCLPSSLAPLGACLLRYYRQKAAIWDISLGKKRETWQQTLNALSFLPNAQLWRAIKETHFCPTRIFVTAFNHDFSLPCDPLLAAWEL